MSNDVEKVNPKWLDKAEKWYVKKPFIRALMQLLATPTLNVSAVLDTYLVIKMQNMKEKKIEDFF